MPASPRPRASASKPSRAAKSPPSAWTRRSGPGGVALDPLAAVRFDHVAGVAAAPGGKVVAAGNLVAPVPVGGAPGTAAGDAVVARLNADGTADTSFGNNGVARFGSDAASTPAAVAALPDGKTLVAGAVALAPGEYGATDLFVTRLDANGVPDASFGTNGRVVLDLGGSDTLRRMVVQPDGKIVVAGTTVADDGLNPTAHSRLAVARFTADGRVDATFGTGGKVIGPDEGGGFTAGGLAVQSDGKIVVGGHVSPVFTIPPPSASTTELEVFRFNANGTPDTAFGTGGRAATHYGDFLYAYSNTLAVLSDGRIVVGGGSSYGQGLLAWFKADGTLTDQERFGDTGTGLRWVNEVVAVPGGGVKALGYSDAGGFVVEAHPRPGAAADLRAVNLGGGIAAGAGLVRTADGKFVVAGLTGLSPYFFDASTTGGSLAVARFGDPGATESRVTFVRSFPYPSQPAGAVTLYAQVIPLLGPAAVDAGAVTFREGTTVLGSVPLSGFGPDNLGGPGNVRLDVTLPAGDHTITAEYAGTARWSNSSRTFVLRLTPAVGVSVALAADDTNPALGEAVTLSATVARTDGGPATGTVSFFDGAFVIGSAAVDATGVARFTTSTLTTGSHALRASFNGGPDLGVGNSNPVTVDVSRAYTAVALSASTLTPFVGQPVTLTALVTAPGTTGVVPGGRVTFYDGRTILGTAPVENGRAVFTTPPLQVGARTLRATYAGDFQTFGADSTPLYAAVQKATTAARLIASGTGAAGEPITLRVAVRLTAGAAFPVGAIELREGSQVIWTYVIDGRGEAIVGAFSSVTAPRTFTLVYLGCSTCEGSTSPPLTLGGAAAVPTATALAPVAGAVHGQKQTLAATVTSTGKAAAGRVDFYDGPSLVGSAAVGTDGKATVPVVATYGARKWRAVFVAGPGFLGSESAAVSQTVGKAATVVSAATDGNTVRVTVRPAFGGSPIGTVTFKEGSVVVGTAAVNGNGVAVLKLGLLTPGRHRLTAVYGGSSVFLGGASAPLDVVATV